MRNNGRIIRTGVAIAFAVVLMPQMAAAVDKPQAEVCKAAKDLTLTGKIRSLQSMREEPQAEIETFFSLDLSTPLCGLKTVEAAIVGPIPCAEGDTITMTGDFSPPERMFNTARFRGHGAVSCSISQPGLN